MSDKNFDPLNDNLEENSNEEIENLETGIDIETLSTILTDSDIKTDKLIELEEKKTKENQLKNLQEKNEESSIIFDINIKSLESLVHILLEKKYDFLAIEPNDDFVKISFKKDSILKEQKIIKYHTYLNILLQAKKISNLDTQETNKEQKGTGNFNFKDKSLDLLSKTVPSQFGEILFLKVKNSEKKSHKKSQKKKGTSPGTIFGFLGAVLFIAIILGGTFLTFVVFNAKTPDDVSFFQRLGIKLNDINSFLLNLTTVIFSVVVLVETIILIITLFKAILTKKEFKKRKILFSILSVLLIFFTFSTATLWITLDKKIRQLPKWEEMSYGDIQIYDNDLLLKNDLFSKSDSLILEENYSYLIGPINLKFDVKYLKEKEAREGFEIKTYKWDFGDGTTEETQVSEIIHAFNTKGNFKTTLTIEGIDSRYPDNVINKTITSKEVNEMPKLSIVYLVDIKEKVLENGGKTVSYDASSLKDLGEIKWYLEENPAEAVYDKYLFQPSKIYFEEALIMMKITGDRDIQKIFSITGDTSEISGEIDYEVSVDNYLKYTFWVKDVENTFGDGFIENYIWTINGKEIKKEANLSDSETTSKITYNFTADGTYKVKVKLTNSSGKSTTISKAVTTQKSTVLKNPIEIYYDGVLQEDVEYNKNIGEYYLKLKDPAHLKFDATYVRLDDEKYFLNEIKWDLLDDGAFEKVGKDYEEDFFKKGSYKLAIHYYMVHRNDETIIKEKIEMIYLDFIEKDAIIDLNMNVQSEYAPTIVAFDASLSKVKDDDIVKFIYDYGDGTIEERDAKNPGHKYLKEGTYDIKLTVVTEKGKEYSIIRKLVLKPEESKVDIKVSLKKAPVGQEINFLSTGSMGQIISSFWDFGDGETSNEANPSHAFKKAGKYNVTLTLEFLNNNVDSEDIEIEIID